MNMDIAALSMGMSQIQVAQQASISVMKMAMETGTEQMTDMVAMVETAPPAAAVAGPAPDPNIGQLLDISV
jgi:hypothetical protein